MHCVQHMNKKIIEHNFIFIQLHVSTLHQADFYNTLNEVNIFELCK